MLYLLAGENTDEAVSKLREIRAAFVRKNEHGPITEVEGTEAVDADVYATIGGGSLFSKNRLTIFKRMGLASASVQKVISAHCDFFETSNDIFVFWETDPKSELSVLLKKTATKSQAVDQKPEKETTMPRANIFAVVDGILEWPDSRLRASITALRDIDAPDLFSVFLWKLKTVFLAAHGEEKSLKPFVAQRARAVARTYGADAITALFLDGVMADAGTKKDAKNAREYFERFIFSAEPKRATPASNASRSDAGWPTAMQ